MPEIPDGSGQVQMGFSRTELGCNLGFISIARYRLENGRFSDRNRIEADSRVSNRIEISRNKLRRSQIY